MTLFLDPPSPVQNFLNTKAKEAGLYQDYMSIDYFSMIPADKDSAARPGLSLKAFNAGLLCLNGPSPSLSLVGAIDYSTHTVWGISTDAYGQTIISTILYDSSGKRIVYCLGRGENDQVMAIPRPIRTTFDEHGNYTTIGKEQFEKEMAKVRWAVTVTADPEKDLKTRPVKAIVSIASGQKYLIQKPDNKGMLTLGSNPSTSDRMWTIEMQPLGPGSFTYSKQDWVLLTTKRVSEVKVQADGAAMALRRERSSDSIPSCFDHQADEQLLL